MQRVHLWGRERIVEVSRSSYCFHQVSNRVQARIGFVIVFLFNLCFIKLLSLSLNFLDSILIPSIANLRLHVPVVWQLFAV